MKAASLNAVSTMSMPVGTDAIQQPLASDTGWSGVAGSNSLNFAAVLHGANDLRFEQAPDLGLIREKHVRVQIKAVGICGRDVYFVKTVQDARAR